MKKARIILASIVLLAVVGGALAFKAKNFNPVNIWCKTTPQAQCLTTLYTTGDNGARPTTTKPCLDEFGVKTTIYYSESGCVTQQDGSISTFYKVDPE